MIVIFLLAAAVVLITAGNKKVRSSSSRLSSNNKKSLPGNLFSSNPGRATKKGSSTSSSNSSKEKPKTKKALKPHFRWNHEIEHPAYVYDQTQSDFKYIGTTHASRTHGRKNIPFTVNPNPNDKRQVYMRDYSTHSSKRNFSRKKMNDFKVQPVDKSKIEKVKRNYRDKPPEDTFMFL